MKFKKMKKWLSRLVTVLLFLTLVCMTFIVISTKASGGEPELFGYQFKSVLSGSMEPGIKTGSIIAVKPGGDMSRFEKDDVITFINEAELLITHRIVDVVHSGEHVMYETKGDNNNAPDRDLVLSENVMAEYTGFTVPYAGYVINFAQSNTGSALLLILPGVFLILYAGYTIWKAIAQLEKENKRKNATPELVGENMESNKSNG